MGCLKLSYYEQERDLEENVFLLKSPLEKRETTPIFCLNTYRYGFNGQEQDNEVSGSGNHLNFSFRGYDTRLVRMWSIDPLSYKFPFYSPYHFASNSPIIAKDLEGLQSSVILNYSEGSIQINRSEDGKAFLVTQADIIKIEGFAPRSTSPGDASRDIRAGGQLDVFCTTCPSPTGKGGWYTIALPKLKVEQSTTIQVPETIKGTPSKDAVYEPHEKSSGNSSTAVGDVNTDITSIRSQVSGISDDQIKAQQSLLKEGDVFVKRSGIVVSLGTDATTTGITNVKTALQADFPDLDITVFRNGSGASNSVSISTKYIVNEKIADAVDAVPDKTIMVDKTITKTVDPVVVIP